MKRPKNETPILCVSTGPELGIGVQQGAETELSEYDLVILAVVKIAISIPDLLFAAGEGRAATLGVSRSQLYARALERLLAEDPDPGITAQLDAIYGAGRQAPAAPW